MDINNQDVIIKNILEDAIVIILRRYFKYQMENRVKKGYTKKIIDLYRMAPDLMAHCKIYNKLKFLAKVIQQFTPSRLNQLKTPVL